MSVGERKRRIEALDFAMDATVNKGNKELYGVLQDMYLELLEGGDENNVRKRKPYNQNAS